MVFRSDLAKIFVKYLLIYPEIETEQARNREKEPFESIQQIEDGNEMNSRENQKTEQKQHGWQLKLTKMYNGIGVRGRYTYDIPILLTYV